MTEIGFIIGQLTEAYEGDPWFGRNIKSLILEVDEEIAFRKPEGQHSILDLVWHMVTWREFTLSRMIQEDTRLTQYFEQNDWRKLDYNDKTLWKKGLTSLEATQRELIVCLENSGESLLNLRVSERDYDFRKLLHGVIQHDIYHAGQIAYLKKLLS